MVIRKVNPYRNDLSRVIIYFEDKSYVTVSAERARALDLKPGDVVDETLIKELSDEARGSAARATAARIVGRHAMSCATLLKKLKEKGIDDESANAALSWLVDIGIMDDAAYAKNLLSHYRARGFGNRRIREEMRVRGISREIIEEIIDERDMSDEILEYIEKKTRGVELDDKLRAKITNALVRRGHSYEDIKSAFNNLKDGGNGF